MVRLGLAGIFHSPTITRKTDKGLPRYLDWSDSSSDQDILLLSGAEDLVPVLRSGPSGFEVQEQTIRWLSGPSVPSQD
jgi:hypothetical protein